MSPKNRSGIQTFRWRPGERPDHHRGDEAVLRLGESSDGYHASCGKCGSLLYSLVRDGAYVHVTLGTLIDPPTITPTAHIFVGSKAPWDAICDGLPQFETFPTD